MNETLRDSLTDDPIDFGELTHSLGFLLRLAQVQVFTAFYEALAEYGLKPGEFTVLWLIKLNPGLRQGTIAQSLMIKPAHMTKLVQRMVKAGFVKRTVPPDDRRSIRLSLTDKGAAFIETHKTQFLEVNRRERAQMSDAEMGMLLGTLRKLVGLEDAK